MQIKKTVLLLLLIVFVGSFLRLYKLSDVPGSFNEDEAALGYNAYSLLKTGADEHGKFLPLSLQSFGDWKLPIYPYAAVVPIALLGLNEFAVRLPSALAGIVGIVLVYFISLRLFKKETTALFAALFFALSPWSIYFSRAAYEVNLATIFFLAGLLCFLHYFQMSQRKIGYAVLGSVLFGLTLFTYHSFIIFVPLFILVSLIVFRNQMKLTQGFWLSLGVIIIFVIASSLSNVTGGSKKAVSQFVFNDPDVIYQRVEKIRGDPAAKNQVIEKILHNKLLGGTYHIAQNYVNSFSPSFLFDKGGEKLQHNLYGFGNIYLFDALLLFVGMLALFWNREKQISLLLIWLLTAPVASAITKDTPNSTRLFMLMPLFTFIAAYGATTILEIFKSKKISVYGVAGLGLLYLLNVVFFLDLYFVHFNAERIRFWHYGYKQAVELSNKYPDYRIAMRGPENFPYIYFLFYNKYDPVAFRKEATYYPMTDEGFLYVKSFGKYSFPKKIDYDHLAKKTVYIDDTSIGDKSHAILFPPDEPILGYTIAN